jgi:hypothetical protein
MPTSLPARTVIPSSTPLQNLFSTVTVIAFMLACAAVLIVGQLRFANGFSEFDADFYVAAMQAP